MRAALLFLIVIVFVQAKILREGSAEWIQEYRRRERYQDCLKHCVNKSKRVKDNEVLCSECSLLLNSDDSI
ncbi:unnamed protein product [Cylicocyclus nassatus]|uniref:Uncharacterized protein n=1 Tax=Cylicocyclus nassatus TaxID=53992 RepID=A0AA36DN22_CYLNA|nr:unnamed protein product [Cylicocyclus nassatus]